MAVPPDLVALGVVRGAYGVKGWTRVAPYADGAVLEQVAVWWLQQGVQPTPLTLQGVRRHAGQLVAKWQGCETPEAADALKGAEVAVARSAFPALAAGEVYLADLMGARVVNRAGEELGSVQGLRSNGVQQLLEVAQGESALLIPMLEGYIDRIDVAARTVQVDWERDW